MLKEAGTFSNAIGDFLKFKEAFRGISGREPLTLVFRSFFFPKFCD